MNLGLSSICNLLGAIKTSKTLGLGPNDMIATVATDGSELYVSEMAKARARFFAGGTNESAVAKAIAEHLDNTNSDHTLVLSEVDRNRIFNLGYFTWVEQQGVTVEEFETRRSQDFWRGLRPHFAAWDSRIQELNRETRVRSGA